MRITLEEAFFIKQCVAKVFGQKSHVYLFGSRVDDAKFS